MDFYINRPFIYTYIFLHGSWQSDCSKGGKAGTTTDHLHLQKFHDRTVRNTNHAHELRLCTSRGYRIASSISRKYLSHHHHHYPERAPEPINGGSAIKFRRASPLISSTAKSRDIQKSSVIAGDVGKQSYVTASTMIKRRLPEIVRLRGDVDLGGLLTRPHSRSDCNSVDDSALARSRRTTCWCCSTTTPLPLISPFGW